MQESADRGWTYEAQDDRGAVIDAGALQRWLAQPEPASTRGDGGPLSTAILEVLLDVVNAAVFVVASEGDVLLANRRGRSLLGAHEESLRPYLQGLDPSERPTAPGVWEVATRALGSLRICRRGFAVSGSRRTLVTIESVEATFEEILRAASTALHLTARQSTVFRLVLEGLSNKEIANILRTSERTVEVHVTAILQKAGVDSRMRLIAKTWDLARASGRSR